MSDEKTCPGPAANNDDEGGDGEIGRKNPHKHDSGAADLEKVTDFVEDKELRLSGDTLGNLIDTGKKSTENVTKITIKKEDVELIVRELEVPKSRAEKKLREHRGNAKNAMKDLLGFS